MKTSANKRAHSAWASVDRRGTEAYIDASRRGGGCQQGGSTIGEDGSGAALISEETKTVEIIFHENPLVMVSIDAAGEPKLHIYLSGFDREVERTEDVRHLVRCINVACETVDMLRHCATQSENTRTHRGQHLSNRGVT